jgi:ABC-type antimicrobial peptide transport system permease subunit
LGFTVIAGRIFQKQTGCRVAVINQEAADRYFGGKALGAAVIDNSGIRSHIIGVVREAPVGAFEARVQPSIYFPMAQDFQPRMTMILAAREASGPTLAGLRSAIEAVPGRGFGPVIIRTLETQLGLTALAPLRIATMMIGVFTAMALFLSILGLFATLSDTAHQRRREFAIRIALGAGRGHIVFQLFRDGARLAGAGAVAGTLAAFALSIFLSQLTRPALWVWLAAPLMLAVAVAIASVVPAMAVSMVNPLRIIRDDN